MAEGLSVSVGDVECFQTIVDGEEGSGGHEHGVAHRPCGGGTDEDAVEKEGREAADRDSQHPAHILAGGGNNILFVGEDVQELVAEGGVEALENGAEKDVDIGDVDRLMAELAKCCPVCSEQTGGPCS